MIQAMFDEKAGKYRLNIEGSRDDILRDLLEILEGIYQKKILNEHELHDCVKFVSMGKKELTKEILDCMPMIMLMAALGDEEARKIADRFIDIMNRDKHE